MARQHARQGALAAAVGTENRGAGTGHHRPIHIAQDPSSLPQQAQAGKSDCRLPISRRRITFHVEPIMPHRDLEITYVPANLILRSGRNWTAVWFFAGLGALHMSIAIPAF